MSKTRRNFAASHRHIKDVEGITNDSRINRYDKKMNRSTLTKKSSFDEDYSKKAFKHHNYEDFLDHDDLMTDGYEEEF